MKPEDRQRRWDLRYMDLAHRVAGWSKDPSTKVGCVLVRPNNSVASMGFNGFAPGEDDDPKLYEDRAYKNAHVIHAEENALTFLEGPAAGFSAYTSFPPCPICMTALGEAGVVRVMSTPINTHERNLEWVDEWKETLLASMEVAQNYNIEWIVVTRGET